MSPWYGNISILSSAFCYVYIVYKCLNPYYLRCTFGFTPQKKKPSGNILYFFCTFSKHYHSNYKTAVCDFNLEQMGDSDDEYDRRRRDKFRRERSDYDRSREREDRRRDEWNERYGTEMQKKKNNPSSWAIQFNGVWYLPCFTLLFLSLFLQRVGQG